MFGVVILSLLVTATWSSRLPGPVTGQHVPTGDLSYNVGKQVQSSRKHDFAPLCKDCLNNDDTDGSIKTTAERNDRPSMSILSTDIFGVETKRHKRRNRIKGRRQRKINRRQNDSDRMHTSNSHPAKGINGKRTHATRKTEKKLIANGRHRKPPADDGKMAVGLNQDGRWSRQGLRQVPDVARLEQRLHPTVTTPVREIMQSLSRLLQQLGRASTRNEVDYAYIFNSTRQTIMMGLRTHLTQLAEQNDKVYDAVMEASLLTKYIYLRAHERRRLGYNVNVPTNVAAVSASNIRLSNMTNIDVHKYSSRTYSELRKAELLKRKVIVRNRTHRMLSSRFITIEPDVVQRIDTRVLHDLAKKAKEIIRALSHRRPRLDFEEKLHLYSQMRPDEQSGFTVAKTTIHEAKDSVNQAHKQFMMGKKILNQITRLLMDHTEGVMADMPFDDSRLLLWATVDSTTKHADHLYMAAAQIHGSLNGLILKGKDTLLRKGSSSLKKSLKAKAESLKQQIKAIDQLLDHIRVVIGDKAILTDRCKAIYKSSPDGKDITDVIDCDVYVTVEGNVDDLEGSGDTEGSGDIDGSGEIEADTVDIYLPAFSTQPASPAPVNPISKYYTRHKIDPTNLNVVGEFDDDELVVVKKTTTAPTLTVSDKAATDDVDVDTNKTTSQVTSNESTESSDDFTFTDMFGFFSDDPQTRDNGMDTKKQDGMADTDTANVEKHIKLNKLIRVRLLEYVNRSKSLNEMGSKAKEKLSGLIKQWKAVKEIFSKVTNSTGTSKTFIRDWAATKLKFGSVHEAVQAATNSTSFKISIAEEKYSHLASSAHDKAVEVERRYQERLEKQTGDTPTPKEVTEAVNAVNEAKMNVADLVKLTQIMPEPCGAIQTKDKRMKANITELRKKIEKAKTIASSLQRAVAMTGKGYISVPVKPTRGEQSRLTSVLQIDVKPTDTDGTLAALETPETGVMVLSIEDMVPSISVLDNGGYSIATVESPSQMEVNSWYTARIQRTASTYILSVYDTANNATAVSNLTVDDQHAAPPSAGMLYMGGVPSKYDSHGGHWRGCIGSAILNGRYMNMWHLDNDGNKPTLCSQIIPPGVQGSMILGNHGYISFPVAVILGGTRHIQQIKLTFRAYSDGILLNFKLKHMRMFGEISIKSGRIIVTIKHSVGEAELESNENVYTQGFQYVLEITINRNIRGPKSIMAALNEDATVFTISKEEAAIATSDGGFFLGGNPVYTTTRSASACIKSVHVNSKQLEFSMLDQSADAYYGSCPETNCVEFTDHSLSIDLEEKKSEDIRISFVYGSYGPLVQYSKGDKYSITVDINMDGLEITDSVADEAETIPLTDMEHGDHVIVTIKDIDDEVYVTCVDMTKEFSYEGGGGWFRSDDVVLHKLTVAGSTDSDVNFEGKIVDIIINQESLDTSQYLVKNGLQRCTAMKERPAQQDRKADNVFNCLA